MYRQTHGIDYEQGCAECLEYTVSKVNVWHRWDASNKRIKEWIEAWLEGCEGIFLCKHLFIYSTNTIWVHDESSASDTESGKR